MTIQDCTGIQIQDLIDLNEIEIQQRVRQEVPVDIRVRAKQEMEEKLASMQEGTEEMPSTSTMPFSWERYSSGTTVNDIH